MNELYQNEEKLYEFLKFHLPSNIKSLVFKCSNEIENIRKQILIQQRAIQTYSLLEINNYPKKHIPNQKKLVEFIFNQCQISLTANELPSIFIQDASIFIPLLYDNLDIFADVIIHSSKTEYFNFIINSSISSLFGNFSSNEYTKLASVFYTHIVGHSSPEIAIQIIAPFFQSLPTFRFIECVMIPFSIHYGSEIRLRTIAKSINNNTQYDKSAHSISVQLLKYIHTFLPLIPTTHIVILNLMKSLNWSKDQMNNFFFHQFFIHEAKKWIESSPYAGQGEFFKQIVKDAFTFEEMYKITSNLTKVTSYYELPSLCQTSSQSFLLICTSPLDIVLISQLFLKMNQGPEYDIYRNALSLAQIDESFHFRPMWIRVFPTSVGKSLMPSPSLHRSDRGSVDIRMFLSGKHNIFPLFVSENLSCIEYISAHEKKRRKEARKAASGGSFYSSTTDDDDELIINDANAGSIINNGSTISSLSTNNQSSGSGSISMNDKIDDTISSANRTNSGSVDSSNSANIGSVDSSNSANIGSVDIASAVNLPNSNSGGSASNEHVSNSADKATANPPSPTENSTTAATDACHISTAASVSSSISASSDSKKISQSGLHPASSSRPAKTSSAACSPMIGELSKADLSRFNSLYSTIERDKSLSNLTVYDSISANDEYTRSLHSVEKEKFMKFALEKNLQSLLADAEQFEQFFNFEVQRKILEENLLLESCSLYNTTFTPVAVVSNYEFLTNKLKGIQLLSQIRPFLINIQNQFQPDLVQMAKSWKKFTEEIKESTSLFIFKNLSEQRQILFWECVEQLKTLVIVPLVFRFGVFNDVMKKIQNIKNKKEFIFNVLVMANNEKIITSFSLFSSCLMKSDMFRNFLSDDLISMWAEFESTFLSYLSMAKDQNLPLMFIGIQELLEEAISPIWTNLKIEINKCDY